MIDQTTVHDQTRNSYLNPYVVRAMRDVMITATIIIMIILDYT